MRKGQGLSMSTIVIAAISVMVLLILGVFFTGGFREIGTSMTEFVEDTSGEGASDIVNCNNWCIQNQSVVGVAPNYPADCVC